MSLRRLPMCAELINKNFSDYSLLDIGCRTMTLKPMLKGCKLYHGSDITPGDGVFECDLEKGISFAADKSYDIVVALDVLEHLENAHGVLQEMLRVAKKAVIVSLPNMYYWSFRTKFLLGNGLGGKYGFPAEPIKDRHRWLLSYTEAVRFIENNAHHHRVETHPIICERGKTKYVIEPLEKHLAKIFPNLFTYGMLSLINVEQSREPSSC